MSQHLQPYTRQQPRSSDDYPPERDRRRTRTEGYTQYTSTYTAHHHDYYISTGIGEPYMYVDMIHTIRTANEHDAITFHLNCLGGILATGIQIINAIKFTAAHCTCIIEGSAESMASLIFLACDELVVHDYSSMMIHNFSGGGGNGKGHEIAAAINATTRSYQQLAKQLYKGFLTPSELKQVFSGADIYLQSEEIRDRLAKMTAKRRK